MLPNQNAVLPFPPSFVFQDVDDQVLEHEDEFAPAPVSPGAWQVYMSKMFTPEHCGQRA
jgi:hypothetical protein